MESYTEAIRDYKTILKDNSLRSIGDQALYGLSWVYYEQKDFDLAAANLLILIKDYKDSPLLSQARYFEANIYSQQGRSQKAIDTFNKVAGIKDPVLANESYFMMGQILFDAKDYLAAIKFFHKVEPIENIQARIQKKIDVWQKRRKTYYKTGLDLERILQKILELKAQQRSLAEKEDLKVSAWYRVGLAYYELARYYEARIVYKEIRTRFPKSGILKETRHGTILALLEQKKTDMARKAYLEFLSLYPGDDLVNNIRFMMGLHFTRQKKFSQAAEEYRAGLEEFPKGGMAEDSQYEAGNCYFYMNKFELAGRVYQQFIDDCPNSQWLASSKLKLAYCYFAQGQNQEALDRYLELYRNYQAVEFMDEVIYSIGLCYFELGKYRDSIAELEELLEKFPKSAFIPEALYKIGDNYFNLEDFKKAREAYQRLITECL
ncbi:MAG: tetratricopeptide repeat protein, partial [Candidatus Omnitrophica bacterium]|nr:tetratricopeptide repeat protein [Candidatus Omnitrophota bacterium]